MRSEQDCKPHERYLFTEEIFSDNVLSQLQRDCISFADVKKDIEKGPSYFRFINWKRKDNEIALFTLYAYADLQIPKHFDCIFDLDNPDRFEVTDLILKQSIINGWFPIDSIMHGHKHVCIFEFKNELPNLFRELYVRTQISSRAPKDYFRLGICRQKDFREIKKDLDT
jgi:hypothetical protein